MLNRAVLVLSICQSDSEIFYEYVKLKELGQIGENSFHRNLLPGHIPLLVKSSEPSASKALFPQNNFTRFVYVWLCLSVTSREKQGGTS